MAETQSSLPHYLHLLRRQLWLIVLVVALAIGAAIGVTSIQQPLYSASTSLLVTAGASPIDPRIANDVQTFTQTMTEVLEGYDVAQATIQKLGLNISTGELRSRLDVSSRPNSAIIRLAYKAPDPNEAILTVRTIRDTFIAKIKELNKQGTQQTVEAQPLVIQALPIDQPHGGAQVSPRPVRNLSAAGALGLVLGLILAFAREAVDDRIRSRRDAERWFGARVIGTLPRGLRGRPPFGLPGQPAPPRAEFIESLQLLRANLEFSEAGMTGPTTVVTSALPEEGKSTVVANLGVALALAGHDVICVEADMRRPRLQHYLGLRSTGGLVDFLEARAELPDLLQTVTLYGAANGARRKSRAGRSRVTETGLRVDAPEDTSEHPGRLRVLLAGAAPSNPADLFTGDRVSRLIEELSTSAEFVLFDTPPLLLVGDAFPLVRVSDTVLVVAREGKTKRGSAEAVKATLEGLGVPKVSVVLTDSRGGGGYGYGYGYGYGAYGANGDGPPER